MKLSEMPWYNLPGARLKRHGVKCLNDAELLSIILSRGSNGKSVLECSNEILKVNNFRQLSELNYPELLKITGNSVKAMKICALFEICNITNRLKRKGFNRRVRNAEDVFNYFFDELRSKKKEYLFVVLLNSANYIIRDELISIGTLDSAILHPREIFKVAVQNSAKSIILVHNHPSGDMTPSNNDYKTNEVIVSAGKVIDIEVLDHIIISKFGFVSIMQNLSESTKQRQ